MKTPEQLAEIFQNALNNHNGRYLPWSAIPSADWRNDIIVGIQAVIAARLDSIEGMPNESECVDALKFDGSITVKSVANLRNLMLSAIAKQMEEKGAEIAKQHKYLVEPVPTVEADPYAELKAAWEANRRIRHGEGVWKSKATGGHFDWSSPPESYEIEPLPADKWADVKAAHARGEKIEYLYDDMWWPCSCIPMGEYAKAYRIAPSPAPAARMTDEELGDIGAKAAQKAIDASYRIFAKSLHVDPSSPHWETDAPARAAFARAVAEAVRKENTDAFRLVTTECDRLRAENATLSKQLAAIRLIVAKEVQP